MSEEMEENKARFGNRTEPMNGNNGLQNEEKKVTNDGR